MNKANKILMLLIAMITVLCIGLTASACTLRDTSSDSASGSVSDDSSSSSIDGDSSSSLSEKLEITMSETLSMKEGETTLLTFTSNLDLSKLSIAWRSSDRETVDFVKGSDGFATLTAKKPGTATVMLTVMVGTDTDTKQTYTCVVTVAEYTNDSLRIVYAVESDAGKYAVATNMPTDGYKYNDDVTITVTPELGYAFSGIYVGNDDAKTRYDVSDFTKNEEGGYTLSFKAKEKPEGSEKIINVPVTVEIQEITFVKDIDSSVIVSGLSEDDKYAIDQIVTLNVNWVDAEASSEKVFAVFFNGTELVSTEGAYSFTVSSAVNSLVVRTSDAEKVLTYKATVVENTSFIQDFKTASTYGVLLATFKYDQAQTAERYQFGVRLYNETSFLTRIDVKCEGDDMGLIDSYTATQYPFENDAAVKQMLVSGTFGIALERRGTEYDVYVTDGDQIVKAFTVTVRSSTSYWNKIGCTPASSTPLGGVIEYTYRYFDGKRSVSDYLSVNSSITTKNVTVGGITDGSAVSMWKTVEFTVKPNSGCNLSSVIFNGEALTPVSESDGVYTYSVTVLKPEFVLSASAEDPTAPATITWKNENGVKITVLEGEKTEYCATDVIKFKAVSENRLIIFDGIAQNELTIAEQDGVFTVRLVEGENVIEVSSHSAIVSGSSSGYADKETETLKDQYSLIEQNIAQPSPFGTLVTTLKFEEATSQTADKWRIDLRFYSAEDTSKFFPISIGKDLKGLCISKRFDQSVYYKDLGEGNYSEEGVLNMLAEGKYRLAIVKSSGKTYSLYGDNGLGKIVYLGKMSNIGNITDGEYFLKISFGGTSSGLSNNQARTCSISWAWYDSITDADFILGYHYFSDSKLAATVTAEHATVSGLSEGYTFNEKVTFTVKAETGYAVSKVLVNGKEVALTEDGKAEYVLATYGLNIEVKTVAAKIVPLCTVEGEGSVSGLLDEYLIGDNATFTVSKADNAICYVTLNGETLTASESGEYSFTVGESITLLVRVVSAEKATVILTADQTVFTVTSLNTDENHYDANDQVTFTVTVKQFSGYKANSITVTHNGETLTANENGSYTLTLAGGENTVNVSATAYAKETATVSGVNDTSTGFNIPTDNLEQTGVYVFKIKYAKANTDTIKNDDAWSMDLRVKMSPSSSTNFRAVATLCYTYDKDSGARTLGVKYHRGSKTTTECTLGKGIVYFDSENIDAILDKIAAGTFTFVLVNDTVNDFNVAVYADDGAGNLMSLYSFKWANFNVLQTAFRDQSSVAGNTQSAYACTVTHYGETTDLTVCSELAGLTYTPATEE